MSSKASIRWSLALPLGAFLLAAGCGSGSKTPASPSSNGASSGQGSVLVSLTTTQTPPGIAGVQSEDQHMRDLGIAQLFITFSSIRLYPKVGHVDADSDSIEGNAESIALDHGGHGHHGGGDDNGGDGGGHGGGGTPPDSSFVEVLTNPVTVEVTALADTLGTLLATSSVPAGDYTHLALRITAAYAVTDSGAQVPVVPANPDSLLRILSSFTVVQGQPVEIRIKIDLDRSVHEVPPGSGHFVLSPVLSCGFHHGNDGGGNGRGHGGMGDGDQGGAGHDSTGAGDDSTAAPGWGDGHHGGRD